MLVRAADLERAQAPTEGVHVVDGAVRGAERPRRGALVRVRRREGEVAGEVPAAGEAEVGEDDKGVRAPYACAVDGAVQYAALDVEHASGAGGNGGSGAIARRKHALREGVSGLVYITMSRRSTHTKAGGTAVDGQHGRRSR